MAALIYAKTEYASSHEILLHVQIHNYVLQTTMPEYLLMECTGILLDNAIEASPENSVITAEVDSRDGRAILSIANPGPPISDTLLKKMFKAGYTTKNDASGQHGLGLSFLKNYLEKYNGSIHYSDRRQPDGNYVVFTIEV